MLTQSDREIFHKLLDYLGVELRSRCVSGEPPDRNNASNNGLYFYSKGTGHILAKTTADFGFENNWNVGDEKNAARFLLESCVDFIDHPNLSWKEKVVIENPFFGCSSLEAAALKLDIFTGSDGLGKMVTENLDEDRCKELIGKLCHSLGWEVQPDPDMWSHVMLDHTGNCAAYGRSWLELFICFSNMAYGRCCPFSDNYPKWALEPTASLEELAIKINLNCSQSQKERSQSRDTTAA